MTSKRAQEAEREWWGVRQRAHRDNDGGRLVAAFDTIYLQGIREGLEWAMSVVELLLNHEEPGSYNQGLLDAVKAVRAGVPEQIAAEADKKAEQP